MRYSELNEQKKHGTEGFPIEYYYVDASHPQYEMPLHWHKEFEIVHVTKGRLTLFVDGLEHLLKEGDIITVNSTYLHRGVPDDCVYECIVFELDMLFCPNDSGEFIKDIANGKMSVDVLLQQNDSRLYRTALDVFGAMRSAEPTNKLSVTAALYALFSELYRSDLVLPSEKHREADPHTKMISKTIDWIENNLSENITLTDMAAEAGLNEKYFCRVFKKSTGRTPIDYLNSLRIDHACHIMLRDRKSVTETAMLSGFGDACYFSRIFKKYKGCPPKQWATRMI